MCDTWREAPATLKTEGRQDSYNFLKLLSTWFLWLQPTVSSSYLSYFHGEEKAYSEEDRQCIARPEIRYHLSCSELQELCLKSVPRTDDAVF